MADGSAAVMRPPVEAAIAGATAPVDAAIAGASGLPRLDANPSAGPGNRPPHAGQRARYPNMNPTPKAAPPPPLAPPMSAGDPAVAAAKAAVAAAVTAGRSTLSEETYITDQGNEPACQASKGVICRDGLNLGVGAAACAALATRFEEFLPLLRLGGGAARGSAGPAGLPGAASHQALASAQAPEHAASSEAPDLGEASAQVTPVLLGIWIGKTAVTSMLSDPSTKPENLGGRREDLSLGACITCVVTPETCSNR